MGNASPSTAVSPFALSASPGLRSLLPLLVLLALGCLLMILSPRLAEHLLFLPSREDPGTPPVLASVPGENVELVAEDGVRIHGWWYPVPTAGGGGAAGGAGEAAANAAASRLGAASPLLLYLHGNAGHIGDRALLAQGFVEEGLSVLLLGYRGYGASEGRPSEGGLYQDAAAGYAFLLERGGDPARIVVFGSSMGGAVAAQLAASRPVGGLILESSFTSLEAMARTLYPFLPGFLFRRLRGRFDTLARVREVECPVLVVHGTRDELVPLAMGLELLEAAPGPRDWLGVSGAGHNDVFWKGGPEYFRRVAAFAGGARSGGR